MGYYISAYDESEKEIAILKVIVGGFIITRELGYDWFDLIGAKECDGGVSGMGIEKKIKLATLQKAMEKLKTHNIKEELTQINPNMVSSMREEYNTQKREFINFMSICINWCTSNKKSEIFIGFY